MHRSARWNSIGRGGTQGVRFLASLALFKMLGPEQTGLMNMALVVTGFLDQFKDFGTGQAVIQRRDMDASFLNTVFAINIVLGSVATLGLVLLAGPISLLFDDEGLIPVLRAVGPLFLITCLGLVHRALLTRDLRFDRLAAADIANALTYGGVAIGLAAFGYGVWALVGGLLASSVVSTILLCAYSGWRPHLEWHREHLRSVRSFCTNLMGFNLVNYVLSNLDRVIIGRMMGREALGFYGFALYMTMFPTRTFTSIVLGVLMPALSRLQDDSSRLVSGYLRAASGVALVTFPMLVGLAVVADPLIPLIWKSQWVPAIPLILLLIPVGLVSSVANTTGSIYIAKGRADLLFWTTLCFGAVTLLGLWIGAHWQATGLSAAYSVVMLVLAYPIFAIPFRLIGLRMSRFAAAMKPFVAASALMGAGTLTLRVLMERQHLAPWLVVSCCVFAGVVLYGVVLKALNPAALGDLRAVIVPQGR